MSSLYVSNLFDVLFYKLEERLFEKSSSFRKLIIVPQGIIKETLYRKLGKNQNIATGFKFLELPAALDYLMRLVQFAQYKAPHFSAPMLLSLHLEAILQELLNQEVNLTQDEQILLEPLIRYLQSDVTQKKIRDLSDGLSLEFLHYGLYGGEALKKFCEQLSWQRYLWDKSMAFWDIPYELFDKRHLENPMQFKIEIHLFGFTFIPSIYEKFFETLSSFFTVHQYFLNPSQIFWGDFCSQRKKILLRRFHQKQGAREREIKELEHYLNKQNPFLANFGGLSQKTFNRYVDKDNLFEECFVDLVNLTEERSENNSFLQTMKRDLLYGLELGELTYLDKRDLSIQLHEAPSKKREIEVLLSVLLHLTDKEAILPSDILVLAPDISLYFPFVYEVFQTQNIFAFEVHDLELLLQSEFLQGLWHVFCLDEFRWEPQDLLKLFSLPPFLNKLKLCKKEVELITLWCEKAQIKWGYDQKHRDQIIRRTRSQGQMLEDSEIGTWKYGLERLLLGLVVAEDDTTIRDYTQYFPIEIVEMTQAALLGKFIQVLEDLYKAMQILSSSQLSILEWIDHLQKLVDQFFSVEGLGKEEQMKDFFIEQLKALKQLSSRLPVQKYSFSSLKRYFEKAFQKKGAKFSQANKEVVRFASIQPDKLYGVKVIYVLGMEEESFPRASPIYPLREIDPTLMDYSPTSIEEDRQVLLNIFLYAQEYVVLSCCNRDSRDGKVKNPSFLVEELLELFDQGYRIEGKLPSKQIRYYHKSIGFHESYFTDQSMFQNFSMRDYQLAKHYYHVSKEKTAFIPEFYNTCVDFAESTQDKSEIFVTLQELKTFARNPLQHYFNHVLGIYLDKEKKDSLDQEFALSALDKALFKLQNLEGDFDSSYDKEQFSGNLPLGIFKDIAKDKLKEEEAVFVEQLKSFGLMQGDLFTIELSLACSEPYRKSSQRWIIPSLKIDLAGVLVHIHGTLDLVSKQGLLVQGKLCMQDAIKVWPLYLVFCLSVANHFKLELSPKLLFIKDGKTKDCDLELATESLKNYLEYYRRAHQLPSPMLPAWSEAFLLKSSEDFASILKKSFSESTEFLDDYQKWIIEHTEPFCAYAINDLWGEKMRKLFEPLKIWNSKEVKDAYI
jgi:exodeoxyribonuclease V gamma subunit